ncbi:Fis family transcriptional regulator [Neisseria sicca]|jgi:putative fis-like DNA-binding protein|uniref:Putative Fis-like DNA-binding protein n=1 Tax=Neisseria sicca TaxID=490 RepID=A0A2I1XCE5_NEISI|nr:Fis family transcriptional regulator [Neisseria sicca]MBY6284122.1 Fis family transcriptional regulator [Neisseria flava]OFJ84565.1 Fis family transcriptional regulator [Neisseria sp. HMSC072F04]PLA40265.1 Fis family transcriptional regulator [Neisseria sicca]QTM23207.1 Fis family transcriptional regulator [Neisseria sicca]
MKQPIPDIAQCVEQNLQQYFKDLNGTEPCGVYDMVLHQVEKPMLICVMAQCGGNQSKAAVILGLNRNTLRKKLLQHGLLEG